MASDHALLRERIAKLSGSAGLSRLDDALLAAREADSPEPSSASDLASGAEDKPSILRQPLDRASVSDMAEEAADSSSGGQAATAKSTVVGGGIARGFFNSRKAKVAPPHRAPPQEAPLAAAFPPLALPPGLSADALSNLTMIYDLLHEPGLKLPAQDLDASFKSLWGQTSDGQSNNSSNSNDVEKEGTEVQETVPLGRGGPSSRGRSLIDPSELESLSPDQMVSLIRTRAKVMAEAAFWDAVGNRIEHGLQVCVPFRSFGGSLSGTAFEDYIHHYHHLRLNPFMHASDMPTSELPCLPVSYDKQ